MTQEEKQLLLQDLCARLPYGVKCNVKYIINNETTYGKDVESECTDIIRRISFDTYSVYTEWLGYESDIEDIKPYLRPMSSMTEEEKKIQKDYIYHFSKYSLPNYEGDFVFEDEAHEYIDWLNAHHFDYRGLILKGLAIAVTEENNPYEG